MECALRFRIYFVQQTIEMRMHVYYTQNMLLYKTHTHTHIPRIHRPHKHTVHLILFVICFLCRDAFYCLCNAFAARAYVATLLGGMQHSRVSSHGLTRRTQHKASAYMLCENYKRAKKTWSREKPNYSDRKYRFNRPHILIKDNVLDAAVD